MGAFIEGFCWSLKQEECESWTTEQGHYTTTCRSRGVGKATWGQRSGMPGRTWGSEASCSTSSSCLSERRGTSWQPAQPANTACPVPRAFSWCSRRGSRESCCEAGSRSCQTWAGRCPPRDSRGCQPARLDGCPAGTQAWPPRSDPAGSSWSLSPHLRLGQGLHEQNGRVSGHEFREHR